MRDVLTRSAVVAHRLFRRQRWTWRGEPRPPSRLDIAATFSSLKWAIDGRFPDDKETRYARTGRLIVVRGAEDYIYAVEVGRESR